MLQSVLCRVNFFVWRLFTCKPLSVQWCDLVKLNLLSYLLNGLSATDIELPREMNILPRPTLPKQSVLPTISKTLKCGWYQPLPVQDASFWKCDRELHNLVWNSTPRLKFSSFLEAFSACPEGRAWDNVTTHHMTAFAVTVLPLSAGSSGEGRCWQGPTAPVRGESGL